MKGSTLRFHDDMDGDYVAVIVAVDAKQVPPVLTVEVTYDDATVLTTTTEDDATVIPSGG